MLEMRTSERGSLKSCPQKWWWGQVEGLRPLRPANALWFGSAVHEALAAWYIPGTKRGVHPVETFEEFLVGNRSIIVTNDDEEQEYVDARALGVDMLTRYVEHYGEEPHKDYIAPEFKGSVVLKLPSREVFGTRIPESKLRYLFTYDGVYRDLKTGEIWLDEHKTAASIWDDQLPLDDQAGSYWAIASIQLRKRGILKKNEEIAGIMYNFLRKAMGDTRPWTIVNGAKMYMNKPTKKEHYIRALVNHYGEDDPGLAAEMEVDGPKMTMAQLQEMAEIQGLEVHGDVSASQPPAYFERFPVYRSRAERKTMIRRIQDEALFAEAYRSGALPIVKAPSLSNCRGCQFKRLCELDESGDKLSAEEFKAVQFTREDPYEVYRVSEEAS